MINKRCRPPTGALYPVDPSTWLMPGTRLSSEGSPSSLDPSSFSSCWHMNSGTEPCPSGGQESWQETLIARGQHQAEGALGLGGRMCAKHCNQATICSPVTSTSPLPYPDICLRKHFPNECFPCHMLTSLLWGPIL